MRPLNPFPPTWTPNLYVPYCNQFLQTRHWRPSRGIVIVTSHVEEIHYQ